MTHPLKRQPPYIRLANGLGVVLERAGLSRPSLCPEHLMRRAQARTGLDNWGDASFRTGLDRLTASLEREANLTQIGRIVAYLNLLDHLSVRLRLIDYRASHPEVAAQRIERPLFIVGLPRTGTSILHELLAQDPALRAPATWEVARPVPPPAPAERDADARIARVDRLLGLLEKLSPGFQPIHAVGARLPQECVYMLSSAFASEQFGYMYRVPDYRKWLLEEDLTAAYAWHAAFVQHLQSGGGEARWVLKTPAHLASLKYLCGQYPDACIVWTHRRPLQAIASFSSLACTLRRGFSRGVDPREVGEEQLRHYARVARRGMEERRALGEERFFDVGFSAICDNPVGVIREIYERFSMTLTDDAERRMRAYLRRRPRDLYGEHRYSAAAFGLDSGCESDHFADYLERYGRYIDGA
ncbi:MAG: sulfotransferase [Halioglobus sp.]|nr:sulfotransferase [Halioglobus sp.]